MLYANNKKFRLYAYPFIGAIMYLLFILINPVEDFFKTYANYQAIDFILEFFYIILFSSLTIETGILLSAFFNKLLPWEKSPAKRIIVQLVVQILVLNAVFWLIFYLTKDIQIAYEAQVTTLLVRQAIVLGILMSLLTTAYFTAEYFLSEWNSSRYKALQMEEQAILSKFEALKNQLDPHFLFNNFSVLAALIEEDKEQAINYVNMLSSVYRYVLQSNKQHTVKLYTELQFIEVYFQLYKIRLGEAIELNTNVDVESKNKNVCPMTLQLLIENAIKHNVASIENPLRINIYSKDDFLVCTNNLIPKQGVADGFGIGLQNINEQYLLLTKQSIKISKDNNIFTVQIPLVND